MSSLPKKKSKQRSKKRKKKTKEPNTTFEKGWMQINGTGVQPFLNRIENLDEEKFEHQSIPGSEYSATYDIIFTMCIQKHPNNFSEQLYCKHSEVITQYHSSRTIPAIREGQEKHTLAFLQEWIRRWRDNKWIVDGMRRIFIYLDRFYVPNFDMLPLTEQGYALYRKDVFCEFKASARDAIIDCIRRERENEMQHRDLLKDAVAVFVELGQKLREIDLQIYKNDFEEKFIDETTKFYQIKTRAWLDQDSCPDYMIKAEQCVAAEEARLSSYIHESSKDKLMDAVLNELLKKHQDELFAKKSGISELLENESKEDLARLYRLYESVKDGLKPVADAMKGHISNLGKNFIKQHQEMKVPDKEHNLVRNLISLHERFHGIVLNNFQNALVFQKALKEAFEDFINNEFLASNPLAKFINDVLKKGTKVAVNDLGSTLDHVVMLYGYIRDKDIFERDYQFYLSHRLLQGLSQSEQAEKQMIGKLKTASGYEWANKLEGMFKDVQLSIELMDGWKNSYGSDFDIELTVNVCTTGCWPTSSIPVCTIPAEIQEACDKFKAFYLNKHSGRRLQWRLDQGKADVLVQFNKSTKKTLAVSTYQMMILLLFNYGDTLTFKAIVDSTSIPRDDIQAHLLSLAHPKVRILQKKPHNNQIEDDHMFSINRKFKSNLYRIKVPLFMKLGKSDKLKKAMMLQQQIRRRHQIDAAIVRIMKTRKTLKHIQLITEVVEQVKARFMPSGADIKKRIEQLIDLEYLERDENDWGTYHYLA